MVKNITSAIAV